MVGVEDAYAAWCLDGAVAHFGIQLEAELDGVKPRKGSKGKDSTEQVNRKRQRILERWLGIPMKFRNPTATTGTKQDTMLVARESDGGEFNG